MSVLKPGLRTLLVAVWLVVLATLLWIAPVDGDDAYHHSVLAVEQLECWRNGVVWPRFHPDWNGGTGSFLPSIYSPVVLSLDAGLLSITGEASRAIGLSMVLGLAAVFFLVDGERREGVGTGALLVVAPYLLVDVLARTTPTELWALAGVAGALPMLLPPGVETRQRGLLLLALVVFTVGCQPIMLILVAVPLVAAWLSVPRREHPTLHWKSTASWFTASVVASAIFWLPPVLLIGNFDRASIFGGAYGWRGHFATSLQGNEELGPVLLAVWVALVVTVAVTAWARRRSMTGRIRAELVFAGLCLVLASPLSLPLWLLPGLGLVQFPWRFLGPASLAGVLLLGRLRGVPRLVAGAAFLVPLVLVPVELASPSPPLTADLSGRHLAVACAARYGLAPILPMTPGEYARGFHPLKSLKALRDQPGKVVRRSGGCRFPQVFDVAAEEATTLRLPLQWWPELVLRKGPQTIGYENLDGFMAVRLPSGEHRVEALLGPARAREMGALISVAGILLAGLLWLRERRRAEGSAS